MKVGVGNRSAETPLGTPRARQYNKREARHLKDEHWWRQGQCPHLCGVLSEIVWQIGRNTVGDGFGFRLHVAVDEFGGE